MDRNGLGFSVGIEVDVVFVCVPKMIFFSCGDRLTWFWWVVEIDLVFVSGHVIHLVVKCSPSLSHEVWNSTLNPRQKYLKNRSTS